MKTKLNRDGLLFSRLQIIVTAVVALLAVSAHISTALGQGATAFTYQGQLQSSGTNVNGTNGMIFTLYTAATGNSPIGTPNTNSVAVSNGLFTVDLDFGAEVFNGGARWLGIGVSNGTAVQELSPRTQILPTPYATYAATAGLANTASNFAGGIVQGNFTGNGSGLTNVAASLQIAVYPNPGTFSFVVPTNVTCIIVETWGGGGGGGSGNGSYIVGGGGGGAGGYAKAFYNVSPGLSYQVVVGNGGIAGGTGGSSGMGGTILATGGSPGSAGGGSSAVTPGGLGGTGPASSISDSGIKGGTGKYGTTSGGGDGGDAPCGGPGGVGNMGFGSEPGHAPGGGGGGGGITGSVGAAGGSGEVIVYY